MGASHKEAARAFMRAHPGTTFPAAKRAVARGAVPPKDSPDSQYIPWTRRRARRDNPTSCYFCGASTLIRSMGDLSIDPRRVEVYCGNHRCDAREIAVVAVDDGTEGTAARTDVRVLAEHGPVLDRPTWSLMEDVGDWIPGATPAARKGTSLCPFCGEDNCHPSPGDAAGDTGRIRLRCSNANCDVIDVEVLVLRDGTPWTQDRRDVEGLTRVLPRGEGVSVYGFTTYTLDDFDYTDEEILAARVSGPMP